MCQSHNPRKIDDCMQRVITFLNSNGIRTVACCCGHGKYPPTIVTETEHMGIFLEIFSDVYLERKKRFYVSDGAGLFYIPETLWKKKNGGV